MRREKKRIDGVTFDVVGTVSVLQKYAGRYEYNNIREAYGKPSEIKCIIWDEWLKFFFEHKGFCWVRSRNTNFYTIKGYIELDGKMYQAVIYPTHNDLYELV